VASHSRARPARRHAPNDDLERPQVPINPNIDPITYKRISGTQFSRTRSHDGDGHAWRFRHGILGKRFAHLYLDSVAMNHNSIGRGYETFGNGSAETERRSVSRSDTTMEWYRPVPAPRELTWSARDNLNYQETGALAALDDTARRSKEMLRNFYRKAWDSFERGLKQPPYAISDSGRSGRPGTGGTTHRTAHGPANRSYPERRGLFRLRKVVFRQEPTWFASISPTVTTLSIC